MLALLSFALAADQTLVYDVTVNGQPAGTRTFNLQYFPSPEGERRVVQLVSELKLGSDAWTIRSTGSSSRRGASFNSSMSHNGDVSQVQAVEIPGGGWNVNTNSKKGPSAFHYEAGDARLSTLDVYDPGRNWKLSASGPFAILLVESGDAAGGTLADATDITLTIGGQPVPVRHYVMIGPATTASFDIDVNGFLLRSELSWLGMQVVSTAREIPPPRTFEQIQTIDEFNMTFQEQDL